MTIGTDHFGPDTFSILAAIQKGDGIPAMPFNYMGPGAKAWLRYIPRTSRTGDWEIMALLSKLSPTSTTNTGKPILLSELITSLTNSGENPTIIDFGSGTGAKGLRIMSWLVKFLPDKIAETGINYLAVDGSPDLLNTTVARMTSANLNGVTVSGIQWKFEDDPSKLSQQIATDQPAIGLFLGQTIGNFDAEHRLRLIKKIFTGMPPGSHLIVGFATPPTTPRQIRDLLALYKHPASLRIIANPYLSMGLKLGEDFIVKVLWDQERSLFEAFVFLKRMVIIHIDNFTFTLNPTIPINNFISYRFSMSDDDPLSMPALLRSAGAEMLYSAINHELHYSVVVARSKQ